MSFVNSVARLRDSLWIEWRIALRFLADNPLQTLLISVAISVGAAVIVFITALIVGLQNNVIDRTLGTQAHIRIEASRQLNNLSAPADNKYLWALESPRAQRLQTINNWQEVRDALDNYGALQGELTTVSPLISGPAFAQKGTARASVALMGKLMAFLRICPTHSHSINHLAKMSVRWRLMWSIPLVILLAWFSTNRMEIN